MRHVRVHCKCIVYSNAYLIMRIMDGKIDRAIVDALESVTQELHRQQNQAGDEFRGLEKFQRNNPPMFKGIYDPEDAQVWLKEIEKILRVMVCTEE